MILVPLSSLAIAATVTEIPPFLRGDVSIGYAYDQLSGSITEDDFEVGDRTLSDHRLRYAFVFSGGPGVAAFVELPHYVSSSVSYGSYRAMVYDPATGGGTYPETTPSPATTWLSGSGVGGAWIGVRGTPFSEAFTSRQNHATWLLEGALRTADGSNFLTMADGTTRGAGVGGPAFRLHSAFSKRTGASEPYLSVTWVAQGPYTADVYDNTGTLLASAVEVDPANSAALRAGLEVLAAENDANGSRLSFDLHLGVDYASYATVPSGVYLPAVLSAGEGAVVQQAEALEPGGGLGFVWRPMTYMQLAFFGDVAWHLPQRIESPYAVYTGPDTLRIGAGTTLTVRVR